MQIFGDACVQRCGFIVGEDDVGQEHAVSVEKVYVGAFEPIAVETRFHIPAVEIVVIFQIVKLCNTRYSIFVHTCFAGKKINEGVRSNDYRLLVLNAVGYVRG